METMPRAGDGVSKGPYIACPICAGRILVRALPHHVAGSHGKDGRRALAECALELAVEGAPEAALRLVEPLLGWPDDVAHEAAGVALARMGRNRDALPHLRRA